MEECGSCVYNCVIELTVFPVGNEPLYIAEFGGIAFVYKQWETGPMRTVRTESVMVQGRSMSHQPITVPYHRRLYLEPCDWSRQKPTMRERGEDAFIGGRQTG